MSNLYWLTDEQMARLEPYFPKSHGRPRVDDRRVLSGIVFVNRNGLRWWALSGQVAPAHSELLAHAGCVVTNPGLPALFAISIHHLS